MRLGLVVALVLVAAAIAVGVARPWSAGRASTTVTAQSSLRPGGFLVVVRNDSQDTIHLAQVMVNDAFVGFRARHLALAPREQTRLTIDYEWVAGEPYEIGVLTSTGAIVRSDVGGAAEG